MKTSRRCKTNDCPRAVQPTYSFCLECGISRRREKSRVSSSLRRAKMKFGQVGVRVRLDDLALESTDCSICGLTVDVKIKYPHPLSPSLEHLLPLSKGGKHNKENLSISHLWCNVRRSNRVELSFKDNINITYNEIIRLVSDTNYFGLNVDGIRLRVVSDSMFFEMLDAWEQVYGDEGR